MPEALHEELFGSRQLLIAVEQLCRSSGGVEELWALLEVSEDSVW